LIGNFVYILVESKDFWLHLLKNSTFFEISMNICWNSFQISIHWKLIYYLLKFQQIFIESLELGRKNGWKVNKISLKNNFTDHSLKVQWLFVEIFSLTFKWYKTFTPRHQLYITLISTQFSNSEVCLAVLIFI